MTTVREEQPGDSGAIRTVHECAFGRPGEARLVDGLRSAGKVSLSLVAEVDGQIVGHILFSPVVLQSEEAVSVILGLTPLGVLPEFQRQGIGSLLVQTALTVCRQAGHSAVVVLGHPEYYPRFGFVPASRFGIRCIYGVPDEVFMALELIEGALAGRSGVAVYQPEFDEV